MEPTEQGVLVISIKNGGIIRYENFDYYTMQHPFLVVASSDGTIDHYNSDIIESFTYSIKENN